MSKITRYGGGFLVAVVGLIVTLEAYDALKGPSPAVASAPAEAATPAHPTTLDTLSAILPGPTPYEREQAGWQCRTNRSDYVTCTLPPDQLAALGTPWGLQPILVESTMDARLHGTTQTTFIEFQPDPNSHQKLATSWNKEYGPPFGSEMAPYWRSAEYVIRPGPPNYAQIELGQ
ncbi:hypothetical protein ACTSKR_07580 [Chitinibacteraceae bacterium HSL-7]